MKAEITRTRINSLQVRSIGDTWVWDTKISGFGVKVTKAGVKSYYFQYRMGGRGTQTRRLFLGRCEWTSLENARAEAGQARHSVFKGIDPFDKEKRERVAGVLFDEVGLTWLEKRLKTYKREQGRKEDERIIQSVLRPEFKGREASSITEDDVQELLSQYATRQPQGNRVLGILRQVFKHGIKTFSLTINPAKEVERFKLTARERYLLPDELQRFLSTLDDCKKNNILRQPFMNLLRLLLVTGCRKDEIRILKWTQINFSDKSLRLIAAKTGPRTVFLNFLALEILKNIKPLSGNPFVISSPTGRGALSNTARPWKKFCEVAELEDFRIHDIRHTFASIGADIDVPLFKMGKLLGHATETMTARYSHLATKAQRQATAKIAQAIKSAMNDTA